nr:hypothetical protein [Neorhizobium tomejilense]
MLYFVLMFVLVLVAVIAFFMRRILVSAIAIAIGIVATTFLSYSIIDNGEVGVIKVLGETQQSELLPGMRIVAPYAQVVAYNALPRPFTYEGKVIANDSNPLTVSVGFSVKLSTPMAWKVQQKVGPNYFDNIVVPAGQTASRLGFAEFPWQAAATSERAAVEAKIGQFFRDVVFQQFIAAGLTREETVAALVIAPVQLRESLPDTKVLNAVAEKTASQQDLERQATLNLIAQKEAERREQEGTGVKKLFDALPKDFTAAEISDVLGAIANKTRADAMIKAVETGQVDTVIMNGDTAGGVANSVGKSGAQKAAPQQ